MAVKYIYIHYIPNIFRNIFPKHGNIVIAWSQAITPIESRKAAKLKWGIFTARNKIEVGTKIQFSFN